MPKDFLFITNEHGEQERISYDELDTEVYPQLLRPIGGFCYPANRFLRVPLPEVPFYIKDWLPKPGKAMIYAPPKTGKSFLCLQIADCIGSGEGFLGLPTSQGVVLYIQCELGERVLQDRLQMTGRDYENVYVGTTFSMKLDTMTGQEYLLRAMAEIRPNVLILDPWYKIIAGDENESVDARKITDALDSVIETFNCSVVIIHHPGKDLARGGRGSSVLEDWVDSYIEMKRVSTDDGGLRIKLTPKLLRHSGLPPSPVEADMDAYGRFTLVGVRETVKDKVAQLLSRTPGVVISPAALKKAELGSSRAIYTALEELISDGKAQKVARGGYIWLPMPDDGDNGA